MSANKDISPKKSALYFILGILLLQVFCFTALQSQENTPFGAPIEDVEEEITKALSPKVLAHATKNIQVLSRFEGLPSSEINCMTENQLGQLLIGTANGLSIYNGKEFKNVFKQYRINSIVIDKNNAIWLSIYRRGIIRYQGGKATIVTAKEGLPDNNVRRLFLDSKNQIWVGTDEGLCIIKDNKTAIPSHLKGIEGTISAISEDSKGKIYIGTFGNGLYVIDGAKVSHFLLVKNEKKITPHHKDNANKIQSIGEDAFGNIWIGTRYNGLFQFKEGAFIHKFFHKKELQKTIAAIYKDHQGHMWFGGNFGIIKYDYQKLIAYSEKEGLSTNSISGIFGDKQGSVWVITKEGLHKISEGMFSYERITNNGVSVNAIVQKKNLDYLIGTSKGVYVYDSDFSNKSILKLEGKSNSPTTDFNASDVFVDQNNTIWAGTWGSGVIKWDKNLKGEKLLIANNQCDNSFTPSVVCDDNDNAWFGTLEGLIRYNGKHTTVFKQADGLINEEINVVVVSPDNSIWIGTEKGLSIYHGGKFTNPVKFQNLSVISIGFDQKGNIWIGTFSNGMFVYQDSKIIHFNTEDGLASNAIRSWIETKNGQIWVGTDRGISLYKNNGTNLGDGKFISFGRNEGFLIESCSANAVWENQNGDVYWGTKENLTILKPAELNFDSTYPIVNIDAVHINFIKPNWNDFNSKDKKTSGIQFSAIDQLTNLPEKLKLSHSKNRLSFYYSGIQWSNIGTVQFRYRLLGLSDQWSQYTTETEITYSNLAPGDYEFQIEGISQKGIWSKSPSYFKFEILAPFWTTWWFYSILLLFVLICLYAYIKYREADLKHTQIELETEVNKRTMELQLEKEIVEKQKNKITQSISYAKNIQTALIQDEETIRGVFKKSFVYYKPKDIVSGDFYWAYQSGNEVYVAVVDCTGHGVPGAFMSIIGMNLLEKIINGFKITDPGEILNKLKDELISVLKHQSKSVKDGMEMALCRINKKTGELYFCGSYNPLYLIRDKELMVYTGDKIILGNSDLKKDEITQFKSALIKLKENDKIYLFTDGFVDQKGGKNGKKYYYAPFRKLLKEISQLDMDQQGLKLKSVFNQWKGNYEQTDDICILGIQFNKNDLN